MVRPARWLALALLTATLGCGSDSGASEAAADAAAADGPFEGGDFQLYVEHVDDQCLDGALDLLFMPDGVDQPYALKNQTFIPALEDLPSQYTMKLQAPFSDMPITMESDDAGGMRIRDAAQADVLLGLTGTDDCAADIHFDADITIESPNRIRLVTTATLSGFASPTQKCPQTQSDPCSATLTMYGERP